MGEQKVSKKLRRLACALTWIAFCIFGGCHRDEDPIGGKANAPMSTPAYTVGSEAKNYGVPRAAYVADVMPQPAGAIDGAKLYAATCAACHQVTGAGVPGAFPPLDGSPYVTSAKTDRMASIMLYGLSGPINVKGTVYQSAMPPQGQLKDAELAAIATYVRSSWSNKAEPVDAAVFAEMRKKWGARGPFNINELGEEK